MLKKPNQNYLLLLASVILRNIVIAVLNVVEFIIREVKVLKFYFISPAGFTLVVFFTDGSPCLIFARPRKTKSLICSSRS